jgi:DNA-binding NarL/FixJ family response regulator
MPHVRDAVNRDAVNIDRRAALLSLVSPRSRISTMSAWAFCVGEVESIIASRRAGSFLFRDFMASQTSREPRLGVCLMSPHPLVLEALRRLLATQVGFYIRLQRLGGVLTTKDLQQMPISPATVYVLDVHAPRPVTEAMAAMIRMHYPESYLILVAEEFDQSNAFSFLRLGAKGLLRYSDASAQLVHALETVAAGGFWVPRALLSDFVDSIVRSGFKGKGSAGSARLSPRETQVLDDLLNNRSNKEIAAKLRISERTVKFHVANVLAKFGVGRRADLVLLWYQQQHN